MRKFIFGTTFLLLAPFCLIFLLIAVFFIYQIPTNSSSSAMVNGLGTTVAFAALPTSQNIQSANITQADGRIDRIKQFLEAYNSPLAPYASDIVNAADQYGIDYRLVVSIAMQESGLCRKIPINSYNCWGFGVYGGSAMHFASYQEGIYTVTKALGERYKENGLITPDQIMTEYTPSSNGSWANGVNYFMDQLR